MLKLPVAKKIFEFIAEIATRRPIWQYRSGLPFIVRAVGGTRKTFKFHRAFSPVAVGRRINNKQQFTPTSDNDDDDDDSNNNDNNNYR